MKRSLLVILAVVFLFALSSCAHNEGPVNNTDASLQGTVQPRGILPYSESAEEISRERAIELALNDAGFYAEDVYDLEAELDRERGGVFWEIDFEHGGYEYSYYINTTTGEITKAHREFD